MVPRCPTGSYRRSTGHYRPLTGCLMTTRFVNSIKCWKSCQQMESMTISRALLHSVKFVYKKEAQLSLRDRSMLRVIKYFTKSLEVPISISL